MLRALLLAIAAGALLLSSATNVNACKCLAPRPLSECDTGDTEAAILVTIQFTRAAGCDINTAVVVADVVVDKIFRDNTGLGLKAGDMTTIISSSLGLLCGIGSRFVVRDQWIMFATPSNPPRVPDPSICDMLAMDAVLGTNSCSKGNIMKPTNTQIDELMLGCSLAR